MDYSKIILITSEKELDSVVSEVTVTYNDGSSAKLRLNLIDLGTLKARLGVKDD